MSQKNSNRQNTVPVIVASAAVTLAIGVTAGSLGGYVHPRSVASDPPQPSLDVSPAEPDGSQTSVPPSIVFVPVAPADPAALDPEREPLDLPATRARTADYAWVEEDDTDEDSDSEHGRRHPRSAHREHERGHDDD